MLKRCPPLKNIYLILTIVLLCIYSSSAWALNDGVTINDFDVYYSPDASKDLTFNDILLPTSKMLFTKKKARDLSFGWVDHPYWFKIDVSDIQSIEPLMLKVAMPLLDDIHIYIVDVNGNLISENRFGDKYPFYERYFFDAGFVVAIPFDTHSIKDVYIRVVTSSSMHVPITFYSLKSYIKNHSVYLTMQGFFYGLMVVMIFYNIFLFFSTRRLAYLHYALFVATFTFLQMGLKGIGFQFLWPTIPALNSYVVTVSGALSLLFLTLFARTFLNLEKISFLLKINNVMLIISMLFVLATLLTSYRVIIVPLAVTVIAFTVIVLIKGIVRYCQGFKEARFYLMAWFAISLGCFLFLLAKLGVLPANAITINSLQIGSAFEVVLLSLALGDRLKTLRTQLEEANNYLESQVLSRTQELESTLSKLEQANEQLEKKTITDSLTGLYNRYYFDNALNYEVSRVNRHACELSLLLIDIDHFKHINDTWGHLVGDRALMFSADFLTGLCARKSDVVCRYGGEEFAIVLPSTVCEDAVVFANKVCAAFSKSKFYEGDTHIPIKVSIGVSSTSGRNTDKPLSYKYLVSSADSALYAAKQNGRNRAYYYKDEPTKLGGSLITVKH